MESGRILEGCCLGKNAYGTENNTLWSMTKRPTPKGPATCTAKKRKRWLGMSRVSFALRFCEAEVVDQNCPECNRLWKELADATHAHIKIIGQRQLAGICQDSSLLKHLEPILQAAAIRRATARTAFRDHADSHQGREQARTATARC